MMTELVTPQLRQWAQQSVRRVNAPRVQSHRKNRLLLIHLDGVPRGLLDELIQTGRMPFFSKLVRTGEYHLDSAFWGSPASTPCFQAGALYGVRHANLPAYSWYDREMSRLIRMNVPENAQAVESRLHRKAHHSLLEGGGTSYLSLFRAYADNRLCMSALADWGALVASLAKDLRGIRAVRRQPIRSWLRQLWRETWKSRKEISQWTKRLKDVRHEREYFLNRFFLISLGWQMAHTRALIDMIRGVPSLYLVFGNYDEVAHRRGPRSEQAIAELIEADARIEELYAVAQTLEHPYDLVFITDHGHVDSTPLEQRSGLRIRQTLVQGPPVPVSADLERGLLDGRNSPQPLPVELRAKLTCEFVESGNFSHVYFSHGTAPLEAREILAVAPDMLMRAARHPDIGLIALRRRDHAVVLMEGQMYQASQLDGAPLPRAFSKRAVADLLLELPYMPTAGDLVLYGAPVSDAGTVGFAWEFGSHGGLTHVETDSVVAWPRSVPLDLGGMSHSSQLYERLSSYYRS